MTRGWAGRHRRGLIAAAPILAAASGALLGVLGDTPSLFPRAAHAGESDDVAACRAKADPADRGVDDPNLRGDLLFAQGDLAGALACYRATHGMVKRLADVHRRNAGAERDLSVSHNKIGDVRGAQGDLAGALESFHAALAIRQRLAATYPSAAGRQRDLAISHVRIGAVRAALGDRAGALERYRTAHDILKRLARTDPSNAGRRRDHAVSLWRLAEFPESGVGWSDVADAWEAMAARGILAPADRPALDEARRRAAAQRE